MMGVTVCHLLIIVIEFPSPSSTLWDSHFRLHLLLSPPVLFMATFSFPFILRRAVAASSSCVAPAQPSPAATLAALSTDAPPAMASTTMTWCASPATKATLWKGRRPASARPPASGASSPRHAEVGTSLTGATEGSTAAMLFTHILKLDFSPGPSEQAADKIQLLTAGCASVQHWGARTGMGGGIEIHIFSVKVLLTSMNNKNNWSMTQY